MNESDGSHMSVNPPAKAAWVPPTIEEIDYAKTEAAYIPGAPADLGIYTV